VPDKFARFHEAVLKKRGIRFPKKPPVDVSNIEKLLQTSNRAFPLIAIHQEKTDAGACCIGRVADLGRRGVTLLEIGPDASWDVELETYRLSEITQVDFGGGGGNTGTTPGTYVIAVTGTSGTATESGTISLAVQ